MQARKSDRSRPQDRHNRIIAGSTFSAFLTNPVPVARAQETPESTPTPSSPSSHAGHPTPQGGTHLRSL